MADGYAAFANKVNSMNKNGKVVEMRFLVPPHLVELVRKAMAPFPVEERAAAGMRNFPGSRPDGPRLTNQELDLLLRG